MSDALDPAAYVFQGIWTDWSKGSTRGLTLTLSPTSATFVTNSLALFVTLAGGQLWTILRFSLHQLRSAQDERASHTHDPYQVVLRNATTAPATARLMCKVAWTSRRGGSRPVSQAISLGLFAILFASLFMIAGTVSNKVIMTGGSSTAPSPVLSRSKNCGVWNQTYIDIAQAGVNLSGDEALALSVQLLAKEEQDIALSLEYAQQCYVSGTPRYISSTCNTLQRSSLSWMESGSSCPFEPQICHENTKSLVFDTGLINSHTDLGINAKHQDRLTYRRVTTCTVLNDTRENVKGWDGSVNESTNAPAQEIAYAYYGPNLLESTDWTYSFSNFAAFYTNFTPQATTPYQVNSQIAFGSTPETPAGTFTPIQELEQNAADVVLMFLSFTGNYLGQVNDPWFSAKRPLKFNTSDSVERVQYARESAISTVGCTEKHQFCTSDGNCTPLLGFFQVQFVDSFNSALTSNQNVTLDRILRAVAASSIFSIVSGLSPTSTPMLATNETVPASQFLSLPLPDYQWQLEIRNWHSIAMAHLQRQIVEWGTGQIAPEPRPGAGLYLLPPSTEPDIWFCQNLIILSTVYQSFSVVAIALIASFGTLIVLVSLSIEDLAGWLQTRFRKNAAARRKWDHDEMLRLQHCADENLWRPPPPPKEYVHRSAIQKREPIEMIQRGMAHPEVHRPVLGNGKCDEKRRSSQALPPEHLIFPFPRDSSQVKRTNASINPEMHQERARDSWLAISLDSFDAVVPEIEARNILESGNTLMRGRPPIPPRPIYYPPTFAEWTQQGVTGTANSWI